MRRKAYNYSYSKNRANKKITRISGWLQHNFRWFQTQAVICLRNQQKDLFWKAIQKRYTFHDYLKKITWVVTDDLCYNKLKIKVCKSSNIEQNNVITGHPQDSKTEVNITNNSKFCY